MIFPTYAKVEKRFNYFMVLLQGYNVDVGLKIRRSYIVSEGECRTKYTFERYGWSLCMLKWRSMEFGRKVMYLEQFFMKAGVEKIEEFLFNERRVIIEKSHKLLPDAIAQNY